MATSVTFNGNTYSIPANREPRGWGTSLSSFLVDVANSSLSKSGGNFTLTADTNFGATYGLVAKYFKSYSSNIAASGVLRLANTETISWRNAANNADKQLSVDSSDRLTYAGVVLAGSNGQVPAASIAAGSVSDTEFGYLDGVTSAIQTQLDAKASTSSLTTHTGASTGVHGVTGAVVGTSDSQTLTNKMLTSPAIASPTFSDYTLFTESSAPSTPSAGKVAVYAKTDKKMYRKGSDGVETEIGSGAGSGEINYISNADFETGATTGWATYKDSGATPTDGTGGSPTTLTLSANSSSPMRDSYDFKVAKSAANSQGEGFSYDFSIKTPDKSKKLKIQFDLNSSDSNFTAGDVVVYVYDVTNATLITPSSTSLPKVGASTWQITFDSTTSTSYRLIFHWAVTTATAVNLYFDSFVVGPGVVVQGAAINDWQTYTPTLTNGGTTSTNTGRWRRVGSTMEIQTYAVFTGAGAASNFSIALPTGYTIDSTAISGGTNVACSPVGTAVWSNASVITLMDAFWLSTNGIRFMATGAGANFSGNQLANNHEFGMKVAVPISEWAGNGTVNLGPGAQAYYASNNGSNTAADDTTNFVSGPSQFIAYTAEHYKDVQFPYPIQSGLQPVFQITNDGGTTWFDHGMVNSLVSMYDTQNSVTYGVQLTSVTSTKVRVYFGQYRRNFSATYGGAGSAWSGIAGSSTYMWRVALVNASSPVGFGKADSNSSGLVNPRKGQYSLTVTSSITGWTTVRAVGIYYQDQDGNPRLKFNVVGTVTAGARTGGTVTLTGVTFKNIANYYQAAAAYNDGSSNNATAAWCNPNASTVTLTHNSVSTTEYGVSGDVELDSKPSWA